tara:strand:+ start:225 stop:494 length:270 start_codon:yes stop_codon:yes gene_type:complete
MKKTDLNDKEKIKLVIYDLMDEFIKNKNYDALEFCYILNKITMELNYHFTNDHNIATGLITRSWNEILWDISEEEFKEAAYDTPLKRIQ